MSKSENDLWPSFDEVPKITSPRSIMSEQGAYLAQKTKNLLSANVNVGNTADGRISNRFSIVAPLLKNYSYRLFALYHGAIYYPCEISFKQTLTTIADEEQLRDKLGQIFNDESTIKVIVSLLGQSKEIEGTEG